MNNNTMNVFQPDYTNILKVLNNQRRGCKLNCVSKE